MILVYSLKLPGYEVFFLLLIFQLEIGLILTQKYALDAIGQSLNPHLPLFVKPCGKIKTINIPQTSVPAVKTHSEPLPPIAYK